MGAVLNMRPDLFNAAILGVPFVDCLTTMLDETIPLTGGGRLLCFFLGGGRGYKGAGGCGQSHSQAPCLVRQAVRPDWKAKEMREAYRGERTQKGFIKAKQKHGCVDERTVNLIGKAISPRQVDLAGRVTPTYPLAVN